MSAFTEIVAVGTLVCKIYAACAGAPETFQNFLPEIWSLHVVAAKVKDQLSILGSSGTVRPDGRNTKGLKILYDNLRTIMEELDNLHKRYKSLTFDHPNPIYRLRWVQENLVGLRDKLRSSITLLNTYNGSLAKYVPSPLTYIGVENAKIFLNLCLLGLR